MVHDLGSCYPLIGGSRNRKLCATEQDAFVYSPVMRQARVCVLVSVLLVPATAWAGNSDEVNAGLDVTLTGGAVVATTYTGAALWYNPAGIASINKASLELTGITMQIQIVKVPGLLTIDTDPQAVSEGKTVNFTVIPQAITFTLKLRENLKLGVGLFNSSIRRSFVTEQVTTAPGIAPEARAVGGQNSKIDFFHISGGLAATFGKKQKVRVGGAFDIVVAKARVDATQTVFYDGGEAGFATRSQVATDTGFGLQLKAGIQWVPIPEVRDRVLRRVAVVCLRDPESLRRQLCAEPVGGRRASHRRSQRSSCRRRGVPGGTRRLVGRRARQLSLWYRVRRELGLDRGRSHHPVAAAHSRSRHRPAADRQRPDRKRVSLDEVRQSRCGLVYRSKPHRQARGGPVRDE